MTESELKKKYAIPESYHLVDGTEGLLITHSELTDFTKTAGKFTRWIMAGPSPQNYYGYAELIDGGFIHGCLKFHENYQVSFS